MELYEVIFNCSLITFYKSFVTEVWLRSEYVFVDCLFGWLCVSGLGFYDYVKFIFLFKVSIPKDCKDSTFCKICKKILGPKAKFRLGATVKKGYYKVSGGFYKIRITGNYYFEKLELFAEVFIFFFIINFQ